MLDYFRTFSARYEPVTQAKAATMSPAFTAAPQDTKPLKRKRSHDQHTTATSPSATAPTKFNSAPSNPPNVTQKVGSEAGQPWAAAESVDRSISSPADIVEDAVADAMDQGGPKLTAQTPVSAASRTASQEMSEERSKVSQRSSGAAVRDTIESQFNLEILLKHRELRLIDQELAKCEVAYEQLRRCHSIPFPSQSASREAMLAVSAGQGSVYGNTATDPAPWGVTDGPYSRHYKSWLLPSPTFDDDVIEHGAAAPPAGKRLPDRLTRGVNAEKGIYPTQSRSQRNLGSSRSKTLPQAYPEAKEEKGPMVVPRKSDGHLVKLVCLDCRRSNFNSVQGFINHCRIAHARQFVSHEAAIEASGEELDGDTDTPITPEPNGSRIPPGAGLVHPMIRSARPPTPELETPPTPVTGLTQPSNPPAADRASPSVNHPKPPATEKGQPAPSSAFHASPQTPYLSRLLAKLSNSNDLEDLVADAKKRDEIEIIEAMEVEESSDEEKEDTVPLSRSTRGIAQSSVRPASASSSMPLASSQLPQRQDHPMQPPTQRLPAMVQPPRFQAPYEGTARINSNDAEGQTAGLLTPSNLSPNSTDPHPAPSLVSDDGDFYNTHSESESGSQIGLDEDDDHYLQPRFLDHEGLDLEHGDDFGFPDHSKAQGVPGRGRPATSEQRHVTFASPIRTGKARSKALRD